MATIDRDEAIRVVASYPGPIDKGIVRRLLMELPEDKEAERWHELATSYEQTILRLCDQLAGKEQRKTGKWIDETFKPWGPARHPYKCDQCGEHSETDSKFCPNCGAKMESTEVEE